MNKTKDPDPILLEKYLAIKRSRKARRKRVPANTWIKTRKLPTDFQKRKNPPKIDDDDELDSALSSLGVIQCSSNTFSDSKVPSNQFLETSIGGTNPSDDFGTEIDDNLLLDCLLSNLDDVNLIMDQNNLDLNGFQPHQFQMSDSQLQDKALDEYFNNPGGFEFIATTNIQDFGDIQFNQFNVGPPQESILSTTSPFPSSMSSPSIPSTSPEQQLHLPDESKVPDRSSPTVPPACNPPPSSQNASLPLQPSYGKDIFMLFNDRTGQSDSDSESESDSESDG